MDVVEVGVIKECGNRCSWFMFLYFDGDVLCDWCMVFVGFDDDCDGCCWWGVGIIDYCIVEFVDCCGFECEVEGVIGIVVEGVVVIVGNFVFCVVGGDVDGEVVGVVNIVVGIGGWYWDWWVGLCYVGIDVGSDWGFVLVGDCNCDYGCGWCVWGIFDCIMELIGVCSVFF